MKKNNNIIILFIMFFVFLSGAYAITLDSTDNLGEAVNNSAEGDIIELNEGTYKNNVTNISIIKNITIQGKDPNTTIIDAEYLGRIFKISSGATLTLINITLMNGRASNGGAISNNKGSLTIDNSIFKNNIDFGSQGGAIYNANATNLKILNSVFDNNTASVFGGAISNSMTNNTTIFNTLFINNKAPFGAAISSDKCINSSFINSNFTNNIGANLFGRRGSTLDLEENNSVMQGCNILNNYYGIIFERKCAIDFKYNRIFDNTEYDMYVRGLDSNIDYNWWGSNEPNMTKIIGTLNNHFIMDVENTTPLDSNGTVTFNYIFKLNNSDYYTPNLLPYFITEVYTNVTDGIVTYFDARYNKTFDVTINKSGSIIYSFITDYQLKTLEGSITLPPEPETEPPTPKPPTPEPITPDSPNSVPVINKTNNFNQIPVMKETGIPLIALFLILLFSLGIMVRKR